MPPIFNIAAYYKNMARIFRQGPTVPHRIANKIAGPGEFVGSPIGTATAYLRSSIHSFASHIDNQGGYTRLARYTDYTAMESVAEIASALDIYSHEVCSKGEFGEILHIHSDNPEVKDALIRLFYDTLNIEFNAAPWIRSLCKYGDYFLLVDHTPDHGVINLFPMPVNEVERDEGYDGSNPTSFRYRWTTHGNKPIEPWQVIHFRLLGNDEYLPYGMSVLEPARRAWRQLILMEDAVMVYRIVRSPERRVFYIDVGNISPNDVPALIEKAKTQLKRNQIVDPSSGRVDLRYNALSTEDDYFIGVRGKETGTRIETLPGGQFTGYVDDLTYIQNKLFAALKVPKSYLGYEQDGSGGKASLSMQDVRFARTIQHIQRVFLAELEKVAMIQLYSMGFRDEELLNFELSMANPSTINEIQRLELWRTRFEIASLATGQDGVLDKHFIYRHIFKLNDQEIREIQAGRIADKQFQNALDSIIPNPEVPGTEDDTIIADIGDDDSTDADDASVIPLRDPNQQKAIPNDMLDKGTKKRRKPDSLVKHVYNSKKNSLDPDKEIQLLRRIASAPFGEHSSAPNIESIFEKRVKMLNKHTELIDALGPENTDKLKRKKKIIV